MTPPGSKFDERVVVIEHEAFRNLWSAELDGGLIVERKAAEKIEPSAVTIFPDEGKRKFDIAIPQLTRVLVKSSNALSRLCPSDVKDPKRRLTIPLVHPGESVRYRGRHLIDRGILEEYEFQVPYAEGPSGVVSYYTRCVARASGMDRLTGTFSTLAPMIRDYLKERVFERPVELADKIILRRLAEMDAQTLVVEAFTEAIRARSITEQEPTLTRSTLQIFDTPPFPWSRGIVKGHHTVFNLTPVDSALEARFADFLDAAPEVAAWAKLTLNGRFHLEYLSDAGALRYYYPDFVVQFVDYTCMLLETKGTDELDIAVKDRRARRWCEDATRLAGRQWLYQRIDQELFDAYTGRTVRGLLRFLAAETTPHAVTVPPESRLSLVGA